MTEEVSVSALREAVEGMHDCRATFREVVHVREEFKGAVVWDGDVYVFDLTGHPRAAECYAWSAPVVGSEHRRFFAVLRIPPIQSARDAVGASIIAAYRDAQRE
jgi:hypothetical protein